MCIIETIRYGCGHEMTTTISCVRRFEKDGNPKSCPAAGISFRTYYWSDCSECMKVPTGRGRRKPPGKSGGKKSKSWKWNLLYMKGREALFG